jgi:hypothetical protein
MRVWQLEGECSDLALFMVPDEHTNIQLIFDNAFEAVKGSDHLLNDAADWIEDHYGIKRIYIQDYVFTNLL